MFGHKQNSIDINGKNYHLDGGKEFLTEGGHRLPMIWRWPNGIPIGTNSESVVSYIDVFATLAEIIGVELECNQGRVGNQSDIKISLKKIPRLDEIEIVLKN